MIYASTSTALAVLEALVHTEADTAPDDLVAMEIEVVELSVDEPPADSLPAGWEEEIAGAASQSFGGEWVAEGRCALLVLPSALLPTASSERNALLNPAHPEAARARIVGVTPFRFDRRLVEG